MQPSPPELRSGPTRLRTIVGRVATGLALALVVFIGFVVYGMLDNRWYHVVAVEGGSMAPAIAPGDLIVITRPPHEVRVGMILTLDVDGAVVTHRVVEVHRDGTFVTKGDANTTRDDFRLNRVRVVGQFQFRIPYLGSILAAAQAVVSGAFLTADAALPVEARVGEGMPAAPSRPENPDRVAETTSPGEPGPAIEPAPVTEPEPTVPPAPTAEPEPSVETEPSAAPEPTTEPVATLEPEPTTEPATTLEPEPSGP